MTELIAETAAAALAVTRAVDDYRMFRVDIRAVRTAGETALVALRRMERTPGDAPATAYLDALNGGRTAVRVYRRLVAAHLAGNPDRDPMAGIVPTDLTRYLADR